MLLKLTILNILLCFIIAKKIKDTKDPGFVKRYNPRYIQPGNGKRFPVPGVKIFYHYKAFDIEPYKILEDSHLIGRYGYPLENRFGGRFPNILAYPKCWYDVFNYMSPGEIIEITCQPPHSEKPDDFPDKPLNFEIELVDFHGKGRRTPKDEL